MSYYIAKVNVSTDTPKGVKKVNETYLVTASTVTHAEALINKDFQDSGVDFEVKSVTASNILKVINPLNN